MKNIFEVENLRVKYGDFEAVKGVSFTLGAGEILGIVGESGSGKSTIAKTLIGLEKPSGGKIVKADCQVQMIFQDAVGSLNPRMKIRTALEEAIKFGDREQGKFLDSSIDRLIDCNSKNREFENSKNDLPRPSALLKQVGLSDAVLEQYPRELSGGQCQRVSIARALAVSPQVLIADEPVSALDVSVQARILNLLRDLRRELGLSILLIAHDLAVVKNVCDRVCVMCKGEFVDCGETGEVFSNPQSEYTRRLLAAIPRI